MKRSVDRLITFWVFFHPRKFPNRVHRSETADDDSHHRVNLQEVGPAAWGLHNHAVMQEEHAHRQDAQDS